MTLGDKVIVARTFAGHLRSAGSCYHSVNQMYDPVRLSHVSSLSDGLPRGTKIA